MASDNNTPAGESSEQPATLIVANAQLSWLDTGLPYSLDFDDTYHSSEGAQAESRYLFLDGNRITQRWHSAGDAYAIDPGHDAWIEGDTQAVAYEFHGAWGE